MATFIPTLASSSLVSIASKNEVGAKSLLDEIRKIPKAELHLHLGGAWPLEYLMKIASAPDYEELTRFLNFLKTGVHYEEGFKVFGVIENIVNTHAKVEKGIIELFKSFSEDGVTHVEIRTGLKKLDTDYEGYLNAVLSGVEKGSAQYNIKAGVILSLRRDTSKALAEETTALAFAYQSQGVVGLDVSGQSTLGSAENILEPLKNAKKQGIPISLHLGESPKESQEQQMKELEQIKPDRIGHAVHLSGQAKAWIAHHKTPIELCLSSATKVKMLPEAAQHPALELLEKGHPVCICTDDPLLFETSLSKELAQVAALKNLSLNQVVKLQESSLSYSFIK